MPSKQFFLLSQEKHDKIIQACIAEFSHYSYTNSSTNRIVQTAKISKGSLFKYFQNKEELYFYILDCVTQDMLTSLEQEINALPQELFERIIKYSEYELDWYLHFPDHYKLIMTAICENDETIQAKLEQRYGQRRQDIYYGLLETIDCSNLRYSKEQTIDLLKWVLTGFKDNFLSQMTKIDYTELKKEYLESLTAYMTMLKSGLSS